MPCKGFCKYNQHKRTHDGKPEPDAKVIPQDTGRSKKEKYKGGNKFMTKKKTNSPIEGNHLQFFCGNNKHKISSREF